MENNLIERQGNDATVTDEGQNLRVIFNNSKREYLVNKESGNIKISDGTTAERPMKLVVNSGEDGYVVLPISIYENCTIDWGDGTVGEKQYEEKQAIEVASTTPIKIAATDLPYGYEHKYSEYNKEYIVSITGEVKALQNTIGYGNPDNHESIDSSDSLIRITQWGNTNLDTINLVRCNKLIEIASPNEGSFDNLQFVEGAFSETGIKEIPDKFFYGCTKIESFMGTFASCNNLTTVGDNIFGNCTNAKSFVACFESCSNLTNIDEHIFDDCQEVEDFSETFYHCTNLEGNAIPLWERNPVPNGVGCYAGCTKITGDIPDDWKNDPYA